MKMNPSDSPNNSYHAYLLKIWLEQEGEMTASAWRYSLEDAHSGSRRGFTDLDSLLIYLQGLTVRQRAAAE